MVVTEPRYNLCSRRRWWGCEEEFLFTTLRVRDISKRCDEIGVGTGPEGLEMEEEEEEEEEEFPPFFPPSLLFLLRGRRKRSFHNDTSR